MIMQALSVSAHLPKETGMLNCVGRFNHALNFVTPSGELLTLHRYGRGLSPMGWMVSDTDFQAIFDDGCESVEYQNDRLVSPNWQLVAPKARLSLKLMPQKLPNGTFTALWDILRQSKAKSGLHGSLSDVTTGPLCRELKELKELKANYQRYLQGEHIDWQSIIGRGPGLTPSFDDILIGMLLVTFLNPKIDSDNFPNFFQDTPPLESLTTLISVNYLRFASQGIFSTPLQTLATALAQPMKLSQAVRLLLQVGHFSGADTLIGVWLAGMDEMG
ncbi:hypothetical protein NVI2019_PEGOAJLN_02527 [Providencia alcalifaciens]|uniref:DUF2877 domain-containing protein n=1 Tax=Providencia alcalifaciens TaxID=126385 RepID=UPI00044BD36F|nr:DUF2877 domain-containing protein [Providencia alcalifaciens]EUD03142.1 PF11392 family protein [Providencia alcalifaciens RIMD 1656011]CAG9425651.1 hypothetical protein NVI2019_PEGOAJLN_02527 [Providencia alcalifaciens]